MAIRNTPHLAFVIFLGHILVVGCSQDSNFTDRAQKRITWLGGDDASPSAVASDDAAPASDPTDHVEDAMEVAVSNNPEDDQVALDHAKSKDNEDSAPGKSAEAKTHKPEGKPPRATAEADAADKEKCAKTLGLNAQDITDAFKLSKSTDAKEIKSNGAILVKLTGNETKLDLKVAGADAATLKGICVFLAGNKSQLSLKLAGIKLEKLAYVGRGNQTKLAVDTAKDAEIVAAEIDLKGNDSSISYSGEGKHP